MTTINPKQEQGEQAIKGLIEQTKENKQDSKVIKIYKKIQREILKGVFEE